MRCIIDCANSFIFFEVTGSEMFLERTVMMEIISPQMGVITARCQYFYIHPPTHSHRYKHAYCILSLLVAVQVSFGWICKREDCTQKEKYGFCVEQCIPYVLVVSGE